MEQPVRILHVLGNTQLGGAESRIMDLYRHMDRSRVQFDFVVHSTEEGYFNEEIRKLGGRIYRVPRFHVINYFSYRKAWKELLRTHRDEQGRSEFHMIQGHMTSTASIYLPIAKKCGISVTIAHARSAGVDRGLKGMLTRFLRRNLSKKADYLFTCSEIAGISVFGKKAVEQGRTRFLPNAIDCQKFAPNAGVRERIRKELGIQDCCVIGHVGRFHYAKNHEFLLRVFAELVKKQSRNYVLLLLGEGSRMEQIRMQAREYDVEDKVYFLGNKSNVNDYYQAMDYFVYPSRYEGLPGTIVEAQTNGLPCLMSDTICPEVVVTDLVHTLSIQEDPGVWADYIDKHMEYERKSYVEQMKQAGFDVCSQSENMLDFYTKKKLLLMSPMLHQGGFERVCITTARLLKPYYDVTIIVFDSSNIAYNVDGLSIMDIHLGVRKGKLRKVINIIKRSKRVRKIKKTMRPEIVYSFGPTANMVNAFSKTGKEKVWLGLRNYTDVEESSKMKMFVRLADKIICCSKDIEKEVKIKYEFNNTAVLYNLYDTETIKKEAELGNPKLPFKEENLRYLISMGRDDPMKGFWHMVKAFKLVHDRCPMARLILMGAGSFQKYRELAGKLGIEDAVYFAGMRKDPYVYLKYGEIYLLTSGNEGFPNALVEAMTLSLAPVSVNCLTGPAEILTKNDNTKELAQRFENLKEEKKTPVIYGDYGILLPEMSKEENLDPEQISQDEVRLAEVVEHLLTDEHLLQKYRKAASERAHDFSYESYLRQFLALTERT